MPRLSVELTEDQHQLIKATAALQGKSIKDYVLDRALADMEPSHSSKLSVDQAMAGDGQALQALEDLLLHRIKRAKNGESIKKSLSDMALEVKRERGLL